MALKQRNTTRLVARVGTWIAAVFSSVLEVARAFFNIKEGDGLLTGGKKAVGLVVRRATYFVVDYYLVGLSIALVAGMKALGFSFFPTFLAMWVFDFFVAGAFIVYYRRTGNDVTLGTDLRRAGDAIYKKSRILAFLSVGWFVIKAIVWTGPERAVLFFHKEIRTTSQIIIVLLFLTIIQAAIYTPIYSLGYDQFVKLF